MQDIKICKPLFILPNLCGGGAERVVLNLLRQMDKNLFKPTLLLLKNEGVFWSEVPEELNIIYFSDNNERIHENFLEKWINIQPVIQSSDIIIGCLELDATYWAFGLAKYFRKPVIGWVHTPIGPYLNNVKLIHSLLTKIIYPKLNLLVFPSQQVQTSMSVTLLMEKLSNKIIPNPVDIELIQEMGAQVLPDWAKQIYQKKVILGMGRLESTKNFKLLIEAFAIVIQSGLDANLIILGEGNQRCELEGLVTELGLNNNVFLPGFISNPYPFMKNSTIFVMPSHIEGFGMAIVEALGLGIPVIANGMTPVLEWVLQDGKYGLLLKSNMPIELSDLIINLVRDQDLRIALSDKGFIRASEFSSSKIISEWQDLLWVLTHN